MDPAASPDFSDVADRFGGLQYWFLDARRRRRQRLEGRLQLPLIGPRDLMTSRVWMTIRAATRGVLTLWGTTTLLTLLIFAFAPGIGTANMTAARGAITSELIPRNELHAAIGLNTLRMNVARLVGPAPAALIPSAAHLPSCGTWPREGRDGRGEIAGPGATVRSALVDFGNSATSCSRG